MKHIDYDIFMIEAEDSIARCLIIYGQHSEPDRTEISKELKRLYEIYQNMKFETGSEGHYKYDGIIKKILKHHNLAKIDK